MTAGAFLGIDCGGSKSRAAWLPARATSADAPGVQLAVQGVDAAAAALAAALRAGANGNAVTAAVAAVAGAGDRAVALRLAAALPAHGIAFPVAVVGDVLAAVAGALGDGSGVLLWSGTGSFAVARDAHGELHRVGGRGYLLGDQGSGYDFVRRAAAAALLALDGLGAPTELGDQLTRAFAAPQPARLGAVLQQLAPGVVAAQLPVLLACAARGDMVAQEVLHEGGEALALLANAAVRQAELDWRELPIVLGGGVLSSVDAVRAIVAERLAVFGGGAIHVAADDAAARGAALLAQAWHQRVQPMCRWVTDVAL